MIGRRKDFEGSDERPSGALRRGAAVVLLLPVLAAVQAVGTAPASAGSCDWSSSNCLEQPLGVEVSAAGSFGVTYPWSLEKQVDRTRVEVDAGTGQATFNYTVTVRAGAAQPAGWTMGGSVEVSNPNDYEGGDITLTGADVTTDVGGGAVCTTTLPPDPVVPAASGGQDGMLTIPFTCTFTSRPATSGSVGATVTWDPANPTADGWAEGSGPAELSLGQEVDKTVDVIDDKTDPARPVLLEQGLTWSEGLVKTYQYSLTLPGTVGECVAHTNTATVDLPSGTDLTATATVTVCIPTVETPPPPPPVSPPPVSTPPTSPEVLPSEAFGKAVGQVKTTCQGTVRAKLKNRSGVRAVYKLRVGKKVHRVRVGSLHNKTFRTHGRALARVSLKLGGRVLARTRVPQHCSPPEVLPATGLRVHVRARLEHQASLMLWR